LAIFAKITDLTKNAVFSQKMGFLQFFAKIDSQNYGKCPDSHFSPKSAGQNLPF